MRTDREQLRACLAAIVERYHRVQAAAAAEPALAGRLRRLRKFQAERLACTYADLRAQPRYRKAVEFFLSDLYGPADLSARDEQVLRALDKLERFLPGGALEAFAGAMEVHVLTQELDADTARARSSRERGPAARECWPAGQGIRDRRDAGTRPA